MVGGALGAAALPELEADSGLGVGGGHRARAMTPRVSVHERQAWARATEARREEYLQPQH